MMIYYVSSGQCVCYVLYNVLSLNKILKLNIVSELLI